MQADLQLLNARNLAEWSQGVWKGDAPSFIGGVCIDTRTLKPDDLFFALHGDNTDGHEFIGEAFKKGASGAVVAADKVSGLDEHQPYLAVQDPAQALLAMAAGYRGALKPRVVGVTGSVGKSTVKAMTAGMLSRKFRTGSTRGNWNNDIGLPLSILSMQSDLQTAVVEMGTNHPGEIRVLCDLARPECGIVTNVGPVHMEFFGSIEAIAEEKAVLLKALPPDGLAVLNMDNPLFDFLADRVGCSLRTVSLDKDSDYQCLKWDPATRNATILDRAIDKEIKLHMPLPGDFNVLNALMAAAVARWMDLSWQDIDRALMDYQGMPLRWQEMKSGGLRFINDSYNANPMNMRASIRAFGEEIDGPQKWLLLGGMLELGEDESEEHRSLGRVIADGPWSGLIVVGELAGLIADGAMEAGFDGEKIFRCPDREQVSVVLSREVADNSVVLVKGSRRFRLEKIVEDFNGQEKTVHSGEAHDG